MNILILTAGQGQYSKEESYPLCLVEFNSIPLIQRVINSCKELNPKNLIVAFRAEDIHQYHLDSIVKLLWPSVNIIIVQEGTQGAACTALLAANIIDSDEELLVLNANELLGIDFKDIVDDFRYRKLDAGVAVFHSIHPRYSYVKVDDDGLVIEAAEKKPISMNATAGFYWFAKGEYLVRAAKSLIRKDARVNGAFYICPTFNELILEYRRIGIYPVDSKAYYPLKTDRQIEQFENALERGDCR